MTSDTPVSPARLRRADPPAAAPWWRGAVGYQIYVRSFADSDGDGIGDLRGIIERLPYIASLGVDLIWLTPFYPSPQVDHGYDVADYCDVDPRFGTLDDARALLRAAHGHGLRVVVDVVPNHTSDRHPWFVDARRSRSSARREHYIWRDPAPDGGPPNNWVSKFGGPAWTLDETTGQYYLHHFLPEQPDLNWAHPAVRTAFDDILTFWLDLGVDGFRVDTAHLLSKDSQLRDNPRLREVAPDAHPDEVYESFEHLHDMDQVDVVEVYARWHELVAPRGGMLVGEVALPEAQQLERYVVDGALDLAFYFAALKVGWDAASIARMVDAALGSRPDRLAWPLSSHDDPRAAERFGGGPRGARRALAHLAFLCGLPGSTFLLAGDELGLDHGDLVASALQDPISLRNAGASGRDGSRTPMPWGAGPNLGFSSGRPWIAHPADRDWVHTVAAQELGQSSWLQRSRSLLSHRRDLERRGGDAPLRWCSTTGPVVAYRRGGIVVALNTSSQTATLPLTGPGRLRYASSDGAAVEGSVTLPADSAVIVDVDPAHADTC